MKHAGVGWWERHGEGGVGGAERLEGREVRQLWGRDLQGGRQPVLQAGLCLTRWRTRVSRDGRAARGPASLHAPVTGKPLQAPSGHLCLLFEQGPLWSHGEQTGGWGRNREPVRRPLLKSSRGGGAVPAGERGSAWLRLQIVQVGNLGTDWAGV